jgi:Diacylglycerol kinase catalytic domain
MVAVALLTNPGSTGNRNMLPRIRAYCAARPDIFHYEVESADQIGEALVSIAKVGPRVLVINGGDGTVQATLTALHHGGQFGSKPPPVAVLPNGKTNLIALDLGAVGDSMAALERIVDIASADMADHLVQRELISLTEGEHGNRAVLGMFLGGAGLADTILYCRNTIYPLGLPNGLSHFLAGIAVFFALFFGVRGKHLPPAPLPVSVSMTRDGQITGNFAFLIVTTLEKMVLGARTGGMTQGLKLMAIEHSAWSLLKAVFVSVRGKLGTEHVDGLHIQNGDTIRIESERTSVILDGEEFRAVTGRPIVLRSTPPMDFLRLAA